MIPDLLAEADYVSISGQGIVQNVLLLAFEAYSVRASVYTYSCLSF